MTLHTSPFYILLLVGKRTVAVGGTAIVAEAGMVGIGYSVGGVKLPLDTLIGVCIGDYQHFEPIGGKAYSKVVEKGYGCGLVDGEFTAMESF
jgi:hypothetical protein